MIERDMIVKVKTKSPVSANIRKVESVDLVNSTFTAKTMMQYSDGSFTEHPTRVVNQMKKITHIWVDEKWVELI